MPLRLRGAGRAACLTGRAPALQGLVPKGPAWCAPGNSPFGLVQSGQLHNFAHAARAPCFAGTGARPEHAGLVGRQQPAEPCDVRLAVRQRCVPFVAASNWLLMSGCLAVIKALQHVQ